MDYIELICKPQPGSHTAEILIARLAEIGFESFTEGDHDLYAYIRQNEYNKEVERALSSGLFSDVMVSYELKHIADQNWNAVWESEYEPIIVDDRCMVRAPFHPKQAGIEYDIIIEPKMSFGTAHHETTRLMMRYILETDVQGKSLLDMGSGTAVLAILACKKGAIPVTAVDNDEWAYNNAVENVAYNAPGEIEVVFGDSGAIAGNKYDVILANINRNILLSDMEKYRACMQKGGIMILSGFYDDDLATIQTKASDSGFTLRSARNENKWTAAAFQVN